MLRKLLSTLFFVAFFVQMAFAQAGSITGQVTDNNDETIPGANVLLVETGQGAATNAEGNYTISNVEAGTYTLRVTFVGFESSDQEVTVEAGETLEVNVALEAGSIGLEEVVVTGYGDVSKRNFTGSVSQVSSDEFEGTPVASFDQALQGNVAGASITSSTGTPGAAQQIRIRGTSSINAGTSPLFVIDGVPVVSGINTDSDTQLDDLATSSLGILSNLNPSDIESVTILKDASSTAPYGARGSNGVIVIETKEGRSGDVTYSVSVQRGYNNRAVDGPGALNAEEWDQLFVDSYNNYLGEQAYEYGDGTSGYDPSQDYQEWGDVVTRDNAVQQQYNLSARGGNDRTTFYASTGFFEQEGQSIGSAMERFSGKLNISHKFDDYITFNNALNGSYVEQDGILEGAGYFGSPVLAEFFMPPVAHAYNDDGTPNIDNLGTNIFNPVYIQNNDIDRKRNYRVLNNTNLDIRLTDDLSFATNFSLDYILTEEKYYDNPFYGDGEDVRGGVNDINNRNFNYVWRNTLNYIWQLNENNVFDFKAVSESQKNHFNYLDAYGEGIAAAGLYNLNTTATPQDTQSLTEDWALQSFTGLVNYRFNDRLLADLSLRREGNSRFSEDKRWGTFWSIGLGYILSEEDFFQDIDWLNLLKVRTSYGLTGNAAIGLNNYQALVGFGSYNDQPNIQPNQLGNQGLTWEKATSFDVGLEFETFNRLDGTLTYFRKDSYDLLFDVPLSFSTGHESQVQNSGELYNHGFEIELNANIIQTRNFVWNLGGNFTTVKNEVTKLPRDLNDNAIELTTSTRYQAVEGYEVDAWFMREWAGVDPDNGDPLWYMDELDDSGNPTGNRITTNNYNEADSYYQGANAQPTEFGGVNTRIDLYGFYVTANLYYAYGNKVFDSWANYMRSDGAGGYNTAFGQYASQADYWTEENRNAKNPKPVVLNSSNSNATSSRYLYGGDYLRLKTLNIGYNIPTQYLENVGLKSATVYFNGRNLWTYIYDEDMKYDPEVRADGLLDLNAAPLKSITFGIKANF